MKPCLLTGVLAILAVLAGGCPSLNGAPRTRWGSYPSSTFGTSFVDANSLGHHHYAFSFGDPGGIAYTCRGGDIDIDHVKIAADYTKYLSEKSYKALINGDREFTYGLNVDPSKYFIDLEYPAEWQKLSQEQKASVAKEVSIEMGAYLTYTMVSWHEILTWYGFKTVGVLPEFPSAFSWEDSYSNLIGTRLGTAALRDNTRSYDDAMTILIRQELLTLGVLPKKQAYEASEKMRGKWFSGITVPDVKERNFDIGIENGYVTPTLVPGMCEGARPQSYPAPRLDSLNKQGFAIKITVEPGCWESGRIYKAAYPNGGAKRIRLPEDFAPIIADMRQEARSYGYHVMPEKNNANTYIVGGQK